MLNDAETLELLKKLQEVKTGREPAGEEAWNRALAQEDMDYKRQYAEAMRNADREMENVPLMAEYNTTQRYLDKELGRDPVKRVVMNDRARLGSKVRDLMPEGGMTSSANMSRELDPYQKLIAQKQSLMQPKATLHTSIQTEGFSEGTNDALRNSLLALGGAGAAVGLAKAYGLPDYFGSAADRISDKGTIQLPMRRNATDFQYLNSKAQPIVESELYKQGLPPVIEDVKKLELMENGRELVRDRTNPYQPTNRLNVKPTQKLPRDLGSAINDYSPSKLYQGGGFDMNERIAQTLKEGQGWAQTPDMAFSGGTNPDLKSYIKSYDSNPASKLNVGPGGVTEKGVFLKFKGFPKSNSRLVPNTPQSSPPVIENNPTNIFNSKSLGVNDNIDFWNNKTDDVVGHSPIDTSNLKERVEKSMLNDRFNKSFNDTKNYRNYTKTLAGNNEGHPTVDMFYDGSPLSQTEVAGDVLGKLKPKQFKYNVIDDDDMFDKIFDLRRNKPLNVKLKDTGFVEGDYDIPVYENASYNKNYNSKLNMGPGGKTELGEYLNFKGFPKTPSEFVPNLPKIATDNANIAQRLNVGAKKMDDFVPYPIRKTPSNINPIEEIIAENQLKGLENGLVRRPLISTVTRKMTKSLPEVSNIFEKGASKLGGKAALGALASAALFSNPSMAAQEALSSDDAGSPYEVEALQLAKVTGLSYDEALRAIEQEREMKSSDLENQIKREYLKSLVGSKFKGLEQY